MEIHQKISMPNYQKLEIMVKRSVDQKLRLRNFDGRHGRIETGAVDKTRKGFIGVEGGQGICYEWKQKGQCSKRDQCSFLHESNGRTQKPEHTAATPSEENASRGRSVPRKRSIRGKGKHGSILRQPCEYWHPPECQFDESETGCKAGDKCLFPHYKVYEQPIKSRKRATSQKEVKAMTRMLWLL